MLRRVGHLRAVPSKAEWSPLPPSLQVSDHFEEFGDRDNEFDDASTFFKNKFDDKVQNKCKTIFTHFTVATDKNIVNKVAGHSKRAPFASQHITACTVRCSTTSSP